MATKTKRSDFSAEAFIRRNEIIIRLPIDIMAAAYSGGVDLGYIEPGWKVTDPAAFAREVVHELNRENPDNGTTPIHRLFDAVMQEAIEQGADGVEEDPVCDDCAMPVRSCICSTGEGT